MRLFRPLAALVRVALLLASPASLLAGGDDDRDDSHSSIKHALLISIDGMHAVDFLSCSKGVNGGSSYCPDLAELAENGVNYTRTSTSRPSDSFPGLMALVTGGSPKTVGAYYDVAYDRVLAPPLVTTGNGLPGTSDPANKPALAPCVPNQVYAVVFVSVVTETEIRQQSLVPGRPLPVFTRGGARTRSYATS